MRYDWIRITLRLPPQLHERLAEIAHQNKTSLNSQIVTTLHGVVGGDLWAQSIASLPPAEALSAIDRATAEHKRAIEDLERRSKDIDAVLDKMIAALSDAEKEKDREDTPRTRKKKGRGAA
jgi:hypothetical protein